MAVHPRVCGEHSSSPCRIAAVVRFIPACAGNSTHGSRSRSRLDRFIPACAGNSCGVRRMSTMSPVHPRVCGEHALARASPALDMRFIPACAGNTCSRSHAERSCRGSSPRVRGTRLQRDVIDSRASRFIPACAGNTLQSPVIAADVDRFIPACAGNTIDGALGASICTVHPRVCGEHVSNLHRSTRCMTGSSPRVRGTRCASAADRASSRFIPACAGNTLEAPRHDVVHSRFIPACAGNTCVDDAQRRRMTTVHPRVCGEQHRDATLVNDPCRFIPACAGNTLIVDNATAHQRRFIPACAGNTRSIAIAHASDAGSSPRVRGTRDRLRRDLALTPVHPRVCGEHSRSS